MINLRIILFHGNSNCVQAARMETQTLANICVFLLPRWPWPCHCISRPFLDGFSSIRARFEEFPTLFLYLSTVWRAAFSSVHNSTFSAWLTTSGEWQLIALAVSLPLNQSMSSQAQRQFVRRNKRLAQWLWCVSLPSISYILLITRHSPPIALGLYEWLVYSNQHCISR